MSYHTLSYRPRIKGSSPIKRVRPAQIQQLEIEGYSLQSFFNNGLRAMANTLKPGACSSAEHSKCVINIKTTGESIENLFVNFLSKVLKLTHLHQTIFCYMNFKEFSDNRLVAQIYGVWFDGFKTHIKAVAQHGCKVERAENGSCKGTIVLELENN